MHVTLTARPPTTLDGRVVDLATGAPIANMTCLASVSIAGSEGALTGQLLQPTITDALGRFEIAAPIGFDRVTCHYSATTYAAMYSEGGGDFEVGAGGTQVTVAAVRMVPPPSNVGFDLEPYTLPLIVGTVDAAAKSGLAIGDQLVAIDGAALTGLLPGGAMMLATNHRAGTTFSVTVVRNGAPLIVKVLAR